MSKTSTRTSKQRFERAFERGVLRAAFRGLFWIIISERKKRAEGYKLTELAKGLSASKHEVSRWFNGDPNWTINTIAGIADALNVEIRIQAVDRENPGVVYTPSGVVIQAVTTTEPQAFDSAATTSNGVNRIFASKNQALADSTQIPASDRDIIPTFTTKSNELQPILGVKAA